MNEYVDRRNLQDAGDIVDSPDKPANSPIVQTAAEPERAEAPSLAKTREPANVFHILYVALMILIAVAVTTTAGWAVYRLVANDFLPPSLAALVQAIGNGDRQEALEAVEALAALENGAHAMVPVLADMIRDPSVANRDLAATALGRLGSRAEFATPDLASALHDPDARVRLAVVEALGQIGLVARGAAPALTTALEDPDGRVARAAALALGDIRATDTATITALTAALATGDETLRANAALILGQIGHPAATAKSRLRHMAEVERADYAQARAAWATVMVDPGRDAVDIAVLAALLRDPLAAMRSTAADAIALRGTTDPVAISLLTETLRKDMPAVRGTVALALGRVSNPTPNVVAALTGALADTDTTTRKNAAWALGQMAPVAAKATSALILLLEDTDENVQREAYIALKKILVANEQAIDGLEDALNQHPLHGELCGHH